MKFSLTVTLKGILILALLDLATIWLWATNQNLDGAAMYIYILVPFVFFINMIIGGVLFFTKRAYSFIFFINCIVASVISTWVFNFEMDQQADRRSDSWEFNIQDTTFSIDKSNEYNRFSISYSLDPGSSWSFMNGKYEQHKDTLLLNVDSIKMFIHKGKLYNFRQSKKPIKLKAYD